MKGFFFHCLFNNAIRDLLCLYKDAREKAIRTKLLTVWLVWVSVCLLWCLFVCLFVSNKRQNDWTDRAQFFLWDIAWSQGRFMDDQIFKNLPPLKFDFWKFWKSAKFFWKSGEIFCFCYSLTRRTPVYFISNKMGAKRHEFLVYNNWFISWLQQYVLLFTFEIFSIQTKLEIWETLLLLTCKNFSRRLYR